jgi:hypothetical protein
LLCIINSYVDRGRERESRIDNFPVKAEVQRRRNSHLLASRVKVHQKHTRNYVAPRSSVLVEELTFLQKLKKFPPDFMGAEVSFPC